VKTEVLPVLRAIRQGRLRRGEKLIIGLVHDHAARIEHGEGREMDAPSDQHGDDIQRNAFAQQIDNFGAMRIHPFANIFRLDARPARRRMPDKEIEPPVPADAAGA
jgi:hypothetical protein